MVSIQKIDALELLQSLESKSVDMILTDPPYYKVLKEDWDNQWKTKEDYLQWLETIIKESQRVLKDNGSFYMFCSPAMLIKVGGLVDKYFSVLNTIRWRDKHSPAIKNALGMRYYLDNSEEIIFAEKFDADKGYEKQNDISKELIVKHLIEYLNNSRIKAGLTKSYCNKICGGKNKTQYYWYFRASNCWQFPNEENYNKLREHMDLKPYNELLEEVNKLKEEFLTNRKEYENLRRTFKLTADKPYNNTWQFKQTPARKGRHPCEKPAELISHIIDTSSNEGDLIVDMFCGSCVVPKCCEKMGRRCIAGDIDDKYRHKKEENI